MLPYIHQLKMLVKENQITKSEAHKLLKEAKFEYNSQIKAYTI